MKPVLCVIILYFFSSVLGDMQDECNFASFYLELGCKALPSSDNTTCPEAFQCPDLHPDPTKCYYRGVTYDERAMIPQNLIENSCSVACVCKTYEGPQFECAQVDCVETSDYDKQDCILTYDSMNSCCSTGEVCGKDAIAALKTCEMDGRMLREGEFFEPKDSNKKCVCTATWNGSLDDTTTCSNIDCGIEIHNQKDITEKCAPVFVRNAKSCPFSFECPTIKTKIIRGLNLRGGALQCTFGNMTLNFGDEVMVEDKCTKCSCEVPPFVTCMKTAYTWYRNPLETLIVSSEQKKE